MVLHSRAVAQVYLFFFSMTHDIKIFRRKERPREKGLRRNRDLQHCFHAFFSLSGTTYCTACLRILDSVVLADISCTKMYSH